jgi:ABC-2 type transport system permease protein/oleandomycin transport system permease protein
MALLTFASSAFVPIESQPGWLQAFSAHQPLTAVVNAVRALTLGGPTLDPVLKSIAWSVAIIAVFAPIAVAKYRKAA